MKSQIPFVSYSGKEKTRIVNRIVTIVVIALIVIGGPRPCFFSLSICLLQDVQPLYPEKTEKVAC